MPLCGAVSSWQIAIATATEDLTHCYGNLSITGHPGRKSREISKLGDSHGLLGIGSADIPEVHGNLLVT